MGPQRRDGYFEVDIVDIVRDGSERDGQADKLWHFFPDRLVVGGCERGC